MSIHDLLWPKNSINPPKMKYQFRDLVLTFMSIWLSLSPRCFSQVQPRPPQGQQVPCFFIFGDSLVDNGNNNGILTLARANYRPYGIDFPLGPTGRFTNGRTYVDALGNTIIYSLFNSMLAVLHVFFFFQFFITCLS